MKKKMLAAVLSAAMAVSLFAGCGTLVNDPDDTAADTTAAENETDAAEGEETTAAETGEEKTVTVAIPNAWDTLEPLNTNSNYSRFVSDQIYDRLIQMNAAGTFEPRLAESWEVNDDSTAVTFHLSQNVTWQDGEPFTAADVVFSLQTYSDPNVELLSRYYLEYIDGTDDSGAELSENSINVTADDEYTVTIHMKSAMYADTLLSDLNLVYIIPEHIYGEMTADELNTPDAWENPVGTGAFIYESQIEGERIEFKANENYFQGAPEFDKLVIRVVDSASMLATLMSGEADINAYGSIPLTDWDMAQEQENLVCVSDTTTSYTMFIMNESKEYLTKEVRQAINMAIDRDTLVNAFLQGEGTVIYSPFCPLSTYYDADATVEYNPEKAKQILEEQNFPFDQELTFEVANSGNADQLAALIVQNLEAVGLTNVKVKQADFATLMDDMRNGDFDFGTIGSGGIDPSESREMIAPDSSCNFSHVPDDSLSSMVDAANAVMTYEERLPLFYAYQEAIIEDSPMAYLFTKNQLVAYNTRLSNVNTTDFQQLCWSIWTWKVAD